MIGRHKYGFVALLLAGIHTKTSLYGSGWDGCLVGANGLYRARKKGVQFAAGGAQLFVIGRVLASGCKIMQPRSRTDKQVLTF